MAVTRGEFELKAALEQVQVAEIRLARSQAKLLSGMAELAESVDLLGGPTAELIRDHVAHMTNQDQHNG